MKKPNPKTLRLLQKKTNKNKLKRKKEKREKAALRLVRELSRLEDKAYEDAVERKCYEKREEVKQRELALNYGVGPKKALELLTEKRSQPKKGFLSRVKKFFRRKEMGS